MTAREAKPARGHAPRNRACCSGLRLSTNLNVSLQQKAPFRVIMGFSGGSGFPITIRVQTQLSLCTQSQLSSFRNSAPNPVDASYGMSPRSFNSRRPTLRQPEISERILTTESKYGFLAVSFTKGSRSALVVFKRSSASLRSVMSSAAPRICVGDAALPTGEQRLADQQPAPLAVRTLRAVLIFDDVALIRRGKPLADLADAVAVVRVDPAPQPC